MTTHFNRMLAMLFAAALLFSCESEDVILPGQNGFFIVNEGAFNHGNSSLSFLDKSTGLVTNNIFEKATGKPLGDQAQSMTVHDGRGYIVVQNSGKIEVIDVSDYSLLATVEKGVVSPRYFLAVSHSKGYFTDWGADNVSGYIKIMDLETFTVTDSIDTKDAGANQLIKLNDYVYVSHNGGWGKANTIAVVDWKKDEFVQSIQTLTNPQSLVEDRNGDIWVTGTGISDYFNPENDTPGFVAKLDTDQNTIAFSIEAGVTGYELWPKHITTDRSGENLFFIYNGGVSTLPITATAGDKYQQIIDKSFYGLSVDVSENQLIGLEAKDFTNAGHMFRYSLDGMILDSLEVGIAPNSCAF